MCPYINHRDSFILPGDSMFHGSSQILSPLLAIILSPPYWGNTVHNICLCLNDQLTRWSTGHMRSKQIKTMTYCCMHVAVKILSSVTKLCWWAKVCWHFEGMYPPSWRVRDLLGALHSTPLHSTPLHSTPLHFTPLHSTPLHSTPLHSTPLHSTPLHSTPQDEGTIFLLNIRQL
jgi:hypothetical protein